VGCRAGHIRVRRKLYFTILFVWSRVFLGGILLSGKDPEEDETYQPEFLPEQVRVRKEWLEWTDRLGSQQAKVAPRGRMIYENFWITKTVLWMCGESQNVRRRVPSGGTRTTRSRWSRPREDPGIRLSVPLKMHGGSRFRKGESFRPSGSRDRPWSSRGALGFSACRSNFTTP
jgi:hypothetical protein